MRNFLNVLLICGVIWPSVSGHKILFFRSCPDVTPMNSFQVDRFLGKWYIIEVFTATDYVNRCMTMTFDRLTDTDFKVVQSREFAFLDKINVDYQHQYTGTLKIMDSNRPAEMKIKWPSHIIGSAVFRVVDTDYDKYALINDCQNLFVISRLSFAILSRERTLDDQTVSMLRQKIRDMGIDTSPLNVVDQFSCEQGGNGGGTGTGFGIFNSGGGGTGFGTGIFNGTGGGTGFGTGIFNRTGFGTGTGTGNGTGFGTGVFNGTGFGTGTETGVYNRTINGTDTGTRTGGSFPNDGENPSAGEDFPTDGENSTEPIEANLLALLDDNEIKKIRDTYQLAEHLNWQVTKDDLHDKNLPHPKTGDENKDNKNSQNQQRKSRN